MNVEYEIQNLKNQIKDLQDSVRKIAQGNTAEVSKREQTTNEVVNIAEVNAKLVESVYPSWDSNGYSYFAGERVSYEDKYYRCIQNHTSQADWTPDTAVSLWVSISDPSEEYPEWVQPTGAHDAYNKGDKVSHNDKHWISDVDSNVWEPSVYGWSEV